MAGSSCGSEDTTLGFANTTGSLGYRHGRRADPETDRSRGWRKDRLVRGMGYIATLTRPSGTLSHRMGEGRGEGGRVAHPAGH